MERTASSISRFSAAVGLGRLVVVVVVVVVLVVVVVEAAPVAELDGAALRPDCPEGVTGVVAGGSLGIFTYGLSFAGDSQPSAEVGWSSAIAGDTTENKTTLAIAADDKSVSAKPHGERLIEIKTLATFFRIGSIIYAHPKRNLVWKNSITQFPGEIR